MREVPPMARIRAQRRRGPTGGVVAGSPTTVAVVEFEVNPFSPAAQLVARWLAAVFDESDLGAAWPMTAPEFRLAIAQSWIVLEGDRADIAAFDRDKLARLLADVMQPAHLLWPEFAGWRIVRWREILPDFVTDLDLRGTVSGQRLVAPNVEAILITAVRPDLALHTNEAVEAHRFLVRGSPIGWLLAGIGGHLLVPGWPPTEVPPGQ